jgi:hypothetical protein
MERDSFAPSLVSPYYYRDNSSVNESQLQCSMCNEAKDNQYIVLSCNHLLHVQCTVEKHYRDIGADMSSVVKITGAHLENLCCPKCSKAMQMEELMFLYSKHNSGIKEKLQKQQQIVADLELQLNKIKEDLLQQYEKKNSLENQRDTCKRVVSTLLPSL